jgi:hypothetical protein
LRLSQIASLCELVAYWIRRLEPSTPSLRATGYVGGRLLRTKLAYEQTKVGLSKITVTPEEVTFRCETSRTVRNVPSVPFTRT